jgi:hypothetical protein
MNTILPLNRRTEDGAQTVTILIVYPNAPTTGLPHGSIDIAARFTPDQTAVTLDITIRRTDLTPLITHHHTLTRGDLASPDPHWPIRRLRRRRTDD